MIYQREEKKNKERETFRFHYIFCCFFFGDNSSGLKGHIIALTTFFVGN
jgi:hypothetical protein